MDQPTPTIRMRVMVVDPPPGARFAVQRGRSDLLEPSAAEPGVLQFDFSLRTGALLPDGSVNFLGEFAQGLPSDRFVYLNAGTLAGQLDSCWTRRAKLKLASIPRPIVDAALAAPEDTIEARVLGTMDDGGPICASVKPHAVAWRLASPVPDGVVHP